MKNVFILGSINYDLVINSPYIPKSGETLSGNGFLTNSGGKGANQAVAVSKLGGKAHMLGAVGNDSFANECINAMNNYGVNCRFIDRIDKCNTGIAFIIVVDGDNRIILDGGANYRLDMAKIEKNLRTHIKQGDVLITQLEIDLNSVLLGLKIAKEKGAITILNPAPAKTLSDEFYKYVDYIIPNESEAELMSGIGTSNENELFKACEFFKSKGVKNTIITLGAKGCAHYDGKNLKLYSAKSASVVDTTAAGDTFVGAFANMLINGNSIEKSIDIAQTASSITISRKGAQISIPTMEEVMKKYNSK